MGKDSIELVKEIEDSLEYWKNTEDLDISIRYFLIQRCCETKNIKLLTKDIYRIEKLKWKAIDFLSGAFSEEEWIQVFENFGTINLLRGNKEIRKWIRKDCLEINSFHYMKCGINMKTFIPKLMRLSKRTLDLINWLYRYSKDNRTMNIAVIIECLNDPIQVRMNKLKKIKRRS